MRNRGKRAVELLEASRAGKRARGLQIVAAMHDEAVAALPAASVTVNETRV